jgi:protein O-GlcNAc transferase
MSSRTKEDYFEQARTLYLIESYAEAQKELLAAIELDQNWAEPHLLLGEIYFSADNNEAAAAEFRKVTELAPDLDEGFGWLATALAELDQWDEAIVMLREAVRLNPEDVRHPVLLGVYLLQVEQYSEAVSVLQEALKSDLGPGEADARLYLAEALLEDDQTEAACQQWRHILTMEVEETGEESPHIEAKQMLEEYGS